MIFFTGFRKDYVYFLGTPILRDCFEWLLSSHASLYLPFMKSVRESWLTFAIVGECTNEKYANEKNIWMKKVYELKRIYEWKKSYTN